MAVGTTADFDVTREDLLDLSLSLLGVNEASPDDRSLAIKVLNSLVRHMDARAEWLHAIDQTDSTLTLVADQAEYATGATSTTIATNIVRLEYAAVLIGGDREPLHIFDTKQGLRTPLEDDSNAQPIAVHLERNKLLTDNKMIFYPTPNAAYSVVYNYRRPLYDFDTSTDNPDVPGEFVLPLQKLLAAQLAPHFGIPLTERQLLLAEGEREFQQATGSVSDGPSYVTLQTEYY